MTRPNELLDQIERNLAGLNGDIVRLRDDIDRLDQSFAVLKAEIGPLLWMNGIVIAGVLALIIKSFFADRSWHRGVVGSRPRAFATGRAPVGC
jgi:hypothetical protein